eukprot:237665-Amphidinium_carterae.3
MGCDGARLRSRSAGPCSCCLCCVLSCGAVVLPKAAAAARRRGLSGAACGSGRASALPPPVFSACPRPALLTSAPVGGSSG